MKRIDCGESSSVKGIHVLNVREGSMKGDVCFGKEVNKGMCMMIECGGVQMKALVDTGCGANVVFKNAYERMDEVSEQKKDCRGCLRGIGELDVPIYAKMEESVVIAGMKMEA